MTLPRNNAAFIDGENLYLGVKALGWCLDYKKFMTYLREKYRVRVAYIFIGYIARYHDVYDHLRNAGFELVFKPVVADASGKIKGNVDADMVLKAATETDAYDKAVIVSNDGDFYSLVEYLNQRGKLEAVLSPNKRYCSFLLRRVAKEKIWFVDNLRNQMGAETRKGTA